MAIKLEFKQIVDTADLVEGKAYWVTFAFNSLERAVYSNGKFDRPRWIESVHPQQLTIFERVD